ncbi:MAG: leucine-rich repeat domain-containing protein [Spirochaetales bacterium]|nr:leucine-rich repeat domain-containing protein [Spirochaetales bacterium]
MRDVLSVKIKKLENNKQLDPGEVYDLVWHWIDKNTRKLVTGKASAHLLTYYFSEAGKEGYADNEALHFVFTDAAGLCGMSAVASYHWVEISLALLADDLDRYVLQPAGWTWAEKQKSLETLMEKGPDYPLIDIEGVLYCVTRTDDESIPELFTDNGLPAVSFSGLKSTTAKKVREAGFGKCFCPMCNKLRKGAKPLDIKTEVRKEPDTNKFTRISKALRYPHRAQELYVYEQRLDEIPPAIGTLARLRILWVWQNNLTKLPEEIGNLVRLEEFNTGNNNISELPDTIGNLEQLKKLRLNSNRLQRLPETFGKLVQLQQLDLSWNTLQQLPDSFRNLKNLENLELFNSGLISLPDQISDFINLKNFSITNLQHGGLTGILDNLVNLETLRISDSPVLYKQIESFPFDILRRLKRIEICGSGLREIPGALLKLENLQDLILRDNYILHLPDVIPSNWNTLVYVDLCGNPVRDLPGDLLVLSRLQRLDLDYCQIRDLPEQIGQLVSLERLNLWKSSIKSLPLSITNLRNLKELNLDYIEDNTRLIAPLADKLKHVSISLKKEYISKSYPYFALNIPLHTKINSFWLSEERMRQVLTTLKNCNLWFDFCTHAHDYSNSFTKFDDSEQVVRFIINKSRDYYNSSVNWKLASKQIVRDERFKFHFIHEPAIHNWDPGWIPRIYFTGPLDASDIDRLSFLDNIIDFVCELDQIFKSDIWVGPVSELIVYNYNYAHVRPPRFGCLPLLLHIENQDFYNVFSCKEGEEFNKRINCVMPDGTKRFSRDRLVLFQFADDFMDDSITLGLSLHECWATELKEYPVESNYNRSGDLHIPYIKFSQDTIVYQLNGYDYKTYRGIIKICQGEINPEVCNEIENWLKSGEHPSGLIIKGIDFIAENREDAMKFKHIVNKSIRVLYSVGEKYYNPFPPGLWQ